MLPFDEETSRRVESTYTTADMIAQRRVVIDLVAPTAGQAILDIGSGPGFLACELAEAVGATGRVHGVDPSDAMLALARARECGPDAAPIEYSTGSADRLPFPDSTFDLVTATQVYEYVPDIDRALVEAARVLRPGGRLLVLDTDWDSIVWHSSDPERMRRVLAAWDEHLADPYVPRRLTAALESAGFAVTDRSTIPLFNAGYDENAFSAGLIRAIAGYVAGHRGVTDHDVTAWVDDLTALGHDYFFSLNRYVFLAAKPSSR
ncbi:MAG TPA: methyltransferase domain-containing protein [Jatrophihabitantaceae bacterium]|jgi:ubiquinone/menaquinone biosynthesis C-methylase UbiE